VAGGNDFLGAGLSVRLALEAGLRLAEAFAALFTVFFAGFLADLAAARLDLCFVAGLLRLGLTLRFAGAFFFAMWVPQ